MPRRSRKSNFIQEFLAKFQRRFHRKTGFALTSLLKAAVPLVFVAVAIGWTILYTSAREADKIAGRAGVTSKQQTREELFLAMSNLPRSFSPKLPVEKIGTLKSMIEMGKELTGTEGRFSEQAKDRLVTLYGMLCQLQELEGIGSQTTYLKLAELRQQALKTGNHRRVAEADYLRAVAAVSRLSRHTEEADFQFATDAISNLDSKNLVNAPAINRLCNRVINLHKNCHSQAETAALLSLLSGKLIDSSAIEVCNLGLDLKDHVRFAQYYAAVRAKPYSTRESKLQFFRDMLDDIEGSPPQSPKPYRTVLVLIDRLLNKSEGFFAGTLTKRIRKAASDVRPHIKPSVDTAITNIETRLATLGETVDLSGLSQKGKPLQLPNGKPTMLLFCKTGNAESMKYIASTAKSDIYNPWATNVLVACISDPSVEQLKTLATNVGTFTVLDQKASSRLEKTFAIDLLPYVVSLDEDAKVIRLNAPTH